MAEAESQIKEMQFEIMSFDSAMKATYEQRIRKYKNDFDETKRKLEGHMNRHDPEAAMGGDGYMPRKNDGKERLLQQQN